MTTPDIARESARHPDGTFGEQAHTAPEAELTSFPDTSATLDLLSYEYTRDAQALHNKATRTRVEAFTADAQKYVPAATAALFDWDYTEEGEKRLVFSCYLDEDGHAVEDPDGGYPDTVDFAFEDGRNIAAFWFTDETGPNAATLHFDQVEVRDPALAAAELDAYNKVRTAPEGAMVMELLRGAVKDGLSAERLAQLDEDDIARIQRAIEVATETTRAIVEEGR